MVFLIRFVKFTTLLYAGLVLVCEKLNAQSRMPINGLEVYTAYGFTMFSGDLGGSDKGVQFSPKRLNLAVGGGVRYYFSNHWAGRACFTYGKLGDDDATSTNPYRKIRNLNFKSDIYDISLQAEYSIFNWNIKEKRKKMYRLNFNRRHNIFLFTGISIFKFRPYGELNGQWYSLPELATEGQGLPGGKKPYSLYSFSIPMGLGYKVLLSRGVSLGFEITFRKSFTDYIDDVSGNYYDNTALRQHKGEIAAAIADKNISVDGFKRNPSALRGNPHSNDNFAFFFITINKKITIYRSAKRGIPCPSLGM